MKKTTLSAQEIAELDEINQRVARDAGLKLMPVRDRGYARMSNGTIALWHGKPWVNEVGVVNGQDVPPGTFGIRIEGKNYLFDAEELRKYLRWA